MSFPKPVRTLVRVGFCFTSVITLKYGGMFQNERVVRSFVKITAFVLTPNFPICYIKGRD